MSKHTSPAVRAQIIADLKTMTCTDTAKKHKVSLTTVYKYRNEYCRANGIERKRRAIDPSSVKVFRKGFCLVCKKLSLDPHDPPVKMYLGKNAPVCWACNGTGVYIDSIMGKKATSAEDQECNNKNRKDAP